MWVQLNDRLVPDADAQVSIFDRGFMYGEGVFETMRAYNGRVFGLDAHLDRLAASASAIRMAPARPPGTIRADIERVLDRNGLLDAVVRVTLTRGPGPRGLAPPPNPRGTYIVTAEPVPRSLADRSARGIRLKIVSVCRTPSRCLPATAKHSNYLNSVLAHLEAVEAGADEALMLTLDGDLAECAGSNLFFVGGNRLCTPSPEVGILPGIIRATVLDLASAAGLDTVESRFGTEALMGADEVFVTNSVSEILPVRQVDGSAFRVPGPGTSRLADLLSRRIIADTGGL